MPHFDFSPQQAEQLAGYLLRGQAPKKKRPEYKGDVKAGEKTFLTTGCLACHQVEKFGSSGLFGGGDLSRIAEKRSPDFFVRWLAHPENINVNHRMPVFKLTGKEQINLAAYLATLGEGAQPQKLKKIDNQKQAELGRKLFAQNRCAACHQNGVEKNNAVTLRTKLGPKSDWSRSCAGEPQLEKTKPGYRFPEADQKAVERYITTVSRIETPQKPMLDGRLLLVERNCIACHARDSLPGIAAKLPSVSAAHPELAALLSAMTPPPLDSVGDKLHEQTLSDAIRRKSPTHRPWLTARMPKFKFSEQELQAIVRHLVESDRIPDRPMSKPHKVDESVMQVSGPRLITTDGFGCTSCHQVGKVRPDKAPLNARGPDLSMLRKRIRRQWFDRWVRNPSRIVPRMEMPSVQVPVRGVMHENIDDQLAAVWHILNQPGFQPPEPNPIRIVRQTGVAGKKPRAALLTDVLRQEGQTLVKPFVIGLPNRHNVLYDMQSARLSGWWLGDVARQRTKGKSWYWETAGSNLLLDKVRQKDIVLMHNGDRYEPVAIKQYLTEIDSYEHLVDGGIRLRHRLDMSKSNSIDSTKLLHVEQTFRPYRPTSSKDAQSGFVRRVVIEGAGMGDKILLGVAARTAAKVSPRSILLSGSSANRIELSGAESQRFQTAAGRVSVVGLPSGKNSRVVIELRYLTKLPVDSYLVPPIAVTPPDALPLNVVPGYDTVRLPMAEDLLPTSLEWRPDGTLIVTSLMGRVWLAHDRNGDGLEDEFKPFSDELAAPFGAAAGDKYIDVINKYGLLRLWDDDQDGKADRTINLASGWGHTTDYHDWAVGLPKDKQGNYYVTLACQQDNRSAAAAHLRGQVVKLTPCKPTKNNPRHFGIEPISGGHRFPTGIARSREGELFVTDNQGNYNPFNELNHVRQGVRFGFINGNERKKHNFKPPLTPPAIDIPHPWTRSVNGICFLDTPEKLKQKSGKDLFGPFEGHLLGCEYDTRRLIRMSLQRVGDTYQGAAYPFSFDTPTSGEPLLGPLVCAVAPDGDLYLGCLRESGWGAGNNIGTLARMRPSAKGLPAGIAEVRANKDGFVIDFTAPVDKHQAEKITNYSLFSYTRVSTPAYGGDDKDRRKEKIATIKLARNGLRATLKLKELRAGFVYELHVKNLTADGSLFYPAEAHYTMRKIPR